jgi:pimeloyl-ACP methyl ester carboxylesterase
LRVRIAATVRLSYRPAATARQLAAILADGDRSPMLARIAAPTRVVHGAADPLVPADCGRDLAQRIAGAVLDLVDGMGHDLPQPLWPRFVDNITLAAGRA